MSDYTHGEYEISDSQKKYYTPTTEEVRDVYGGVRDGELDWMLQRQFDRWLAKVKREAVAEWQLERLAATIKATMEDYNMGENK
jgi:hypothetical protein